MHQLVQHQFVQIAGALLVLAAFVLAQLCLIETRSRSYLLANLAGATALAVDAYAGHEWGFLLLEGVWAAVSAAALSRSGRPAERDRSRTVTLE
jgi:hypothetical protein